MTVGADLDPALIDRVRQRLAREGSALDPGAVAAAVRDENQLLGTSAVLAMVDQLRLDSLGAGPLQRLLDAPGVTDVLVNGVDGVWVDSGGGLRRDSSLFHSESEVRALAQRLATLAGRRLDDSSPWVDGRLPDGTRLHAILCPVAKPGTLISLRRPARARLDLAGLVAAGSISQAMAERLAALVAGKSSFLVTGATGAGKTTVLSALLAAVPACERIVIVEDSAELAPCHPHVVSLEGRPANIEGTGEITMRNLVRQALRMRPDRLVVGEVRGAEIVDLLAALNTGHEGGCGTVHANDPQSVPARLASLGVMAGLSQEAVEVQAAAALDYVVHVARNAAGQRIVSEIARLERGPGGGLRINTELRHDQEL